MASKKKEKQKQVPAAPENKKLILRLCILIGLFAFLLYANTLRHQFVLDDASVITENVMTRKGSSALSEIFSNAYRAGYNTDNNLYRPLSKAMFAIEWQLSPEDPFIHHFINVLLYAFACMLLFLLLKELSKLNVYIVLAAVLLFVAHPIHTEVVANIKSRDEILAMLFLLLALRFVLKYREGQKAASLIPALACFFLGLLSKESAIVFAGIVPLALYFFSDTPMRKIWTVTAAFAGVAILYLALHKSVIGSIGLSTIQVVDNSIAATTNFLHQRMTAIYIMGKYLLLLIFPHPLSSDYSYNTIPNVTSFGHAGFILSLLVHLFLLGWAIMKLRSKHILSFCILFYFISMAITSNIFMLIGTNMAERLLFFPSIGFCLALAILLGSFFKIPLSGNTTWREFYRGSGRTMTFILLGITALYSIKTIARNRDWRSNVTLFRKDVKTVPNSAHMLMYTTDYLVNADTLKTLPEAQRMKRLLEGQKAINKALSIYDLFPDAHYLSGRIWYELKNYDSSLVHYNYAAYLNPGRALYHNNAGTCYFSLGKYPEAIEKFKKAEALSPDFADHPFNLGSAYGAMGESYRQQNDMENAVKMFNLAIGKFQRTIQLDPEYRSAYQFLGATYMNLGDTLNGQLYMNKAAGIRPKE